ncbi:hypothetical protein BZA77DRAFT_368299 [Pyronema omphalodes]|nr:hypothetical protein BZA77DRAFT_368299 [Pyronema omphalodes]
MDPLSITAAVAGFLSLAGQIATTLKDYVDSVRSAPEEVRSLYLEVKALSQVLENFVGFLTKDDLHRRNLESSCVLISAVQACKYRLEELGGQLADLSEACSKRKLPGWITRMRWPLNKDEVQQTIVALQRFTHIFQFSMVTKNYELMSRTSSAVLSQLDENRQKIQNVFSMLEGMSIELPADLQKQMTEISEIKTLVIELAQFNIKNAHKVSLGMRDVQERLQEDNAIDITTRNPTKDIKTSDRKRLKGTGNWFLLEPAFQTWSNGQSHDANIHPVLACSGNPGAGKSVICSLVFDYLEKQFLSEQQACVACLYCDYQNDKIQTPVNMIGVLLKQVILELNTSRLLDADTISTLKRHLNARKGIDLEEGCRLLGETIKQLRSSQPDTIRIFFTTRPHIKWEELVKRNPAIGSLDHICLKARQEDIRIYITHEIDVNQDEECMNENLRRDILDTIVANSDGMFLLAALQIQTVLDETTIRRRRDALHNMPMKLETAFESTISRIMNQKPQRSKQAMAVLKWVFLAKRPLTMIELRHALSVTIDPSTIQAGKLAISYDQIVDWENFPSEKSLIDWCLGLIIIDEETSTVRLVHKSLHDHLTQLHDNGSIFPDGHSEIAYTCLQYMSYSDDQYEMDSSKPAGDSYSINLNRISTGLRSEFLSPFNDRYGKSNQDIVKHEYIRTNQIHLRLQFAISYGLENIFTKLLAASSPSIDHDFRLGGSTMLLQASRVGNDGIVRILLEKGVNINLADSKSMTALSWAAKHGHDSVVKLLLRAHGIDVESKEFRGRTAFSLACGNDHYSVVKLLLQANGIDINSKDNCGRTAFLWASLKGNDSVVELLLQTHGIDINSKDNRGRTAFSWACGTGRYSVAKLLLQANAIDVNSLDKSGETALSRASQRGFHSVVQLLLQADGIEVNSTDNSGRTALWWASHFGRDSVVELLLQTNGIDIDSKDNGGRTALSCASFKGHDSV